MDSWQYFRGSQGALFMSRIKPLFHKERKGRFSRAGSLLKRGFPVAIPFRFLWE